MALVILEMRPLGLLTGFMKQDSLFGRFDSYRLSLDCLGSRKGLEFCFQFRCCRLVVAYYITNGAIEAIFAMLKYGIS